MFGKEGFGKIHQIGNRFIFRIRPITGELKAVAGFLASVARVGNFADVLIARGVGIIFAVCAVTDDENLDIFIKSAGSPEAVALITVDLVERLANGDAAPFQFHMNQR